MKISSRLSRIVLALAALLSLVAPAVAQPALDKADVDIWLDGYLPQALRTGDIAGAVVVVVRDGRVLTKRSYGWADVATRRPIDPDATLFRVGSLSKLVTWTAVMQQVDAGRLDLDKDVNAYLDFRIPPYRGRPVTLRQLMTHTAGFEEAAKDTIVVGGPPIPLGAYLKRWMPARVYAPGSTPSYSNWGAALAGYIVERAAGMPFADYVGQRIFRPLGMAHSSFRQPLPPSLAAQLATGYLRASAPPPGFETIGPAPAGAVSATATDMAQFMLAHLDKGGVILSPRAAAQMHHSPLTHVDPRSLVPPLDRAELGFLEDNINGHEVIGHRGATQLFHTLLKLFVDDHVGIFVSLNSAGRDGAAEALLDRCLDDFADRYFPGTPVTTRVDPATAATHARMMAGYWQSSRGSQSSFLALASVLGQVRISVDAAGRLTIPSLTDAAGVPIVWTETAPFVWQNGHHRIAAQVAGGMVVRWAVDGLSATSVYDRVPPARSAAWIVPALCLSLGVIALTAAYWPAAWIVRRRYRASIALTGNALRAYRATRLLCFAVLAVLLGWIILLAAMLSNLALISARSDGWLRLLQIGGLLIFVGLVGAAGWNAALTWRDGRGWLRKAWSLLVLLAAVTTLYFAWIGGLLAQGVNY